MGSLLLAVLFLAAPASGFTMSMSSQPRGSRIGKILKTIPGISRSGSARKSAVLDSPATAVDADASRARAADRLVVRFDDKWVDLTGWRKAHPAGSHWIDVFNKADATEVMHAFHSDKAHAMLSRLPAAKPEHIPQDVAEVSSVTRAFRSLRQRLEKEGWFKRNPVMEALTLSGWGLTMAAAIFFAQKNPIAAAILLAVSNTSSGWISHDYIHGRGPWCKLMRNFGELAGGMSATWWSDKHNMHHALTNVVGVDEDLMVDPALFLWAPDPANDSPMRRFQHLYWAAPYSLLFLIWRVDSIRVAWKRKLWGELLRLGAHYTALFAIFSPQILVPSLFMSGLLTATIVTVSHQSEDMFMDGPHKLGYVESQFRSTRDFVCSNPLFEYLSGGMNYQLEHHLFPTMPRYRYPKLVPILKRWAEEQGLEYRVDTDVNIMKRNLKLLKDVGQQPAQEGAVATRSTEYVIPAASR